MKSSVVGVGLLWVTACGDAKIDLPADATPADAFIQVGDPCSATALPPPTSEVVTVVSGGRVRSFTVFSPIVDRQTPSPLVVNMHGYTNTTDQQQAWTKMDQSAALNNYTVVYPQGIGNSWNTERCCGQAQTENIDDVAFIIDIVTRMKANYCIDPKRVYATGYSNGGFLTHRLACETTGIFAAYAPVAAVNVMPTCTPSGPIAILSINGTNDAIVPVGGSALLGFPSLATSVADWRRRNQCTGAPQTTYEVGVAKCETTRTCSGNVEVEQCVVTGGAHDWPGGTVPGTTARDLNANEKIWKFFSAHPLR